MNLRARLNRLEGHHRPDAAAPSVILICDATDGEPGAALFKGGGGIERDPNETAEAFETRATITRKRLSK